MRCGSHCSMCAVVEIGARHRSPAGCREKPRGREAQTADRGCEKKKAMPSGRPNNAFADERRDSLNCLNVRRAAIACNGPMPTAVPPSPRPRTECQAPRLLTPALSPRRGEGRGEGKVTL